MTSPVELIDRQSRTQSPQAFRSAGRSQEKLWRIRKNLNFLIGCCRNPAVIKFQYPRASPGDQPLAKEPEDSGYEIDRSGRSALGSKPHRQARLLKISALGTRLHFLSFSLVAMVMCEKRENSRRFFAEYCSRTFHFCFPRPLATPGSPRSK